MSSLPAPTRLPARAFRGLVQALRGLLAGSVTVLLLAGLPYGLTRYIGWPLPHQLPSLSQVRTGVTSPLLGDQFYLNAIAILIWLLWLLIIVSFAVELLGLLRGVEVPALPGLRPTQALALVLLTALGITALMARAAGPAQAATTPAVPVRASVAATAPAIPASAQTETASSSAAGVSLEHPAELTHTVVSGDNLYDIARVDFGNGNDWHQLYADNAGRTQPDGRKLTDPSMILPGWVLRTTPAQPAPTTPAAPTPHPATTSPSTPATPAPNDAQETTGATASAAPAPTATHTAPQYQDTNTPPRRAQGPAAPSRDQGRGETAPGWVDLAGGGALAAVALAAVMLAYRRARRLRRWYAPCYWPTPDQIPQGPATIAVPLRPAPAHTTAIDHDELDAFGAPTTPHIPAPAEAVAAERPGGSLHLPPEHDQPFPNPAGSDQTEPVRIPLATGDGNILMLQDLGVSIALTGPGAIPAARALTATVLSALEHRRDGARLLLARKDAALLLQQSEADLPEHLKRIPDLELAATPEDAIASLERYLAHRTRLLAEHEADTLEQTPDFDDDEHPPVILLTIARPEHAARLAATLQAAYGLRAHAVLLGEHPGTPAWNIAPDGTATGDTTHARTRMFHLTARELADTLALLYEATGETVCTEQPPTAPDPHGELAVPDWRPDPDQPDTQPDAPEPATDSEPEPTRMPAAEANDDREQGADTQQTTSTEPDVPAEIPRPAPNLLVGSGESGPERIAQILEELEQRPVRIKVLGVRAITTPTGTIDARLRADAWRAAMKLAVSYQHGQHTDDLATLWPDHDDQTLRGTVKNAIYDLRRTLKQRCNDPGTNPGRYITSANQRYRLNLHTIGVDLAAFRQLRALAAQTRDPGERAAAARAALTLYDGDLLTGHDDEWIIAPRAMARRDALATATLLAQLSDQEGDLETALDWWERALQIDDNEEVYRQVITTQDRLGRRADALATRDLLLTRLSTDGLSPAPETMATIARATTRRPPPPNPARSPTRRANTLEHDHAPNRVRSP